MRPTVTRGPVVSYTAVSPLPVEDGRSVLCCAISQVTLGGRYPPSCSMEPGSSSADPNEDHGRGHQEVSSLQLYIRCGKGGIPPCGEAMPLPGYPVFSIVGHSWAIRERRAEYRMGRVGRVVACRMETNQICKSLVCARKSKKTLPIHCSIYHDEQTSQPDKPVSNLLIGDCCPKPQYIHRFIAEKSPGINIYSLGEFPAVHPLFVYNETYPVGDDAVRNTYSGLHRLS